MWWAGRMARNTAAAGETAHGAIGVAFGCFSRIVGREQNFTADCFAPSHGSSMGPPRECVVYSL